MAVDVVELDELERVRRFKRHWLICLGYGFFDAEELSEADVDVHLVAELLAAGCDHATAARIVL